MASFKSMKNVPQPGKNQARKLSTQIKAEKVHHRSAVTGKYVRTYPHSPKPPMGQ